MKFWCLQISHKANQILDRFLPYEARQKSVKNLVGFLGDLKTPKFHSEINWPLKKVGKKFVDSCTHVMNWLLVHFNDQLSPRQCPHGHFLQWSNRTHQICRLGQNPNETQAKCQSSYETFNKTNDTPTKSFLATSLQSENHA